MANLPRDGAVHGFQGVALSLATDEHVYPALSKALVSSVTFVPRAVMHDHGMHLSPTSFQVLSPRWC